MIDMKEIDWGPSKQTNIDDVKSNWAMKQACNDWFDNLNRTKAKTNDIYGVKGEKECDRDASQSLRKRVWLGLCAVCRLFSLLLHTHTQKKRVNVRQIDDVSAWKTIKHWTIAIKSNVNTDVQTYLTRFMLCAVSWNLMRVCVCVCEFILFLLLLYFLLPFDSTKNWVRVNDTKLFTQISM